MLMRKIVGGVSVRNILIISLLAALAVSLTSCYIMREEVTGEVPPEPYYACFPGSYYRKAVSSFDQWTGIEGIIVLPEHEPDIRRWGSTGPLDNFSIYMGGRAGNQEVDAGLTWEITRDEFGNVRYEWDQRAYRPFWRVTSWNNAPARKEFYWYPGDRVLMRVEVAGAGLLRLTIQDADPNPERVFTTVFEASNFGIGIPTQFKRVNAIDQSGNEGKPVQPTKAKVWGAVWEEVYLLRGDKKYPMVPSRFTDMRCPDGEYFVVVTLNSPGGESISIYRTPEK